ncbi:hypothetical protein BJ085DRAFT_15278 [Dimargaris cristalligena]|uniref:mRNA 3'-end-processing protein n=1 Tax=Dimargaris cristalligena TaxID=215637 RepID=A0A4P9ZSC3_9FUNG|nr:hypothetical protein BJ085DRAFT_15278 [Dimargaris cristalligena]|eukprot:RKP35592.1 hypothetical protein BJ085DRAFT_15278 [Dimargaris cristalligena]
MAQAQAQAQATLVDFEPALRNYQLDFEEYTVNKLKLALNGEGVKTDDVGICKFFLKGHCHKGNNCQYQHIKAGKSVVCKHWVRALCKKGDDCDFLHNYNLRKMPQCQFFNQYKVCYAGDACLYLHIDPDAERKECAWYARGFCKHGPKCRNLHVRRIACQNYITGFCPLGPKCPDAHPKDEVPTSNEVIKPKDF